jgi:transcriptional regulator with XRE-family HTH domain
MSTKTSAETLLDLIQTAGLTQKQFALMLDVTPQAVRLWASGRRAPTLPVSLRASRLLNCSIERFAMACKIPVTTDDATDTGTDITV